MELKAVTHDDKQYVMHIDRHVTDVSFDYRVYTKSCYVLWENEHRVGIIVHCILWDNLPFMNLLYIEEKHRGKGYARNAVKAWEHEMKQQGFKMALISTQVDESAQHFYRKLGYVDCGGITFHDTPFHQPMELFLRKVF